MVARFQESWLEMQMFRTWLAAVPDCLTQAYCKICNKYVKAEITTLKRHRQSKVHMQWVERLGGDDAKYLLSSDTGYFENSSEVPRVPLRTCRIKTRYEATVPHVVIKAEPLYPERTVWAVPGLHPSVTSEPSPTATVPGVSYILIENPEVYPPRTEPNGAPVSHVASEPSSPSVIPNNMAFVLLSSEPSKTERCTPRGTFSKLEAVDEEAVAKATIHFAIFIAEYSLPLSVYGEIMELPRRLFPDSRVAARVAIKQKNIQAVIKKLGDYMNETLADQLRSCCFSIIVDETFDSLKTKFYAVLAKFYDSNRREIRTAVLDVIEDDSDSSADSLYGKIRHCLESRHIPLHNLIGFAADGASGALVGGRGCVAGKLREVAPGITIARYTAQSITLCVREAAKALPGICQDLLRNIYNHFAQSAKGRSKFREMHKLCEGKPQKNTDLLANHDAVATVLKHWQPLKVFFQLRLTETMMTLQTIVDALHNPSVFCYLTFLDYILPHLKQVHDLFQKAAPSLHILKETVCELYILLLSCFCRPEILGTYQLSEVDPSDECIHLPLHQLYLGSDLHSLFQGPEYCQNPTLVNGIRVRCRSYLIALCLELRKRFDLGERLWSLAAYLSPRRVMDVSVRMEMPSLRDLVDAVPRIAKYDRQAIDNEWRMAPWHHYPEEFSSPEADVLGFYEHLLNTVDTFGKPKFKNLAQFALEVLSLPTADAEAERLVSKLIYMGCKYRRMLNAEILRNLVYLTESTREAGGGTAFNPNREMLECLRCY